VELTAAVATAEFWTSGSALQLISASKIKLLIRKFFNLIFIYKIFTKHLQKTTKTSKGAIST